MDRIALIEIVIKFIGGSVALIGVYLAVMKYLDERAKSNATAQIESRKPFATRQQQAYFDLVETTAIISNHYGESDWEPAFKRFWVMFWGIIPMVADSDVSAALDRFADTLDDLQNGVAMRNASMDLARACRRSLGASWSASFEEFDKSEYAGNR